MKGAFSLNNLLVGTVRPDQEPSRLTRNMVSPLQRTFRPFRRKARKKSDYRGFTARLQDQKGSGHGDEETLQCQKGLDSWNHFNFHLVVHGERKISPRSFSDRSFFVDVRAACPCQDACFKDVRPKTSSLGLIFVSEF